MRYLIYPAMVLMTAANVILILTVQRYKRLLRRTHAPRRSEGVTGPNAKLPGIPIVMGPIANEYATAKLYAYCLDMRIYPVLGPGSQPCHIHWPDDRTKWCSGCVAYVDLNAGASGPTGPQCPPGLPTIPTIPTPTKAGELK